VATATVAACASEPSSERAEAPVEVLASAHIPVDDTVVLPTSTPAGLAVAASGTLYDHAPLVVLASDADVAGQARAASVAVGVGAPLLLAPASGDPAPSAPVRKELSRLGPQATLSFGVDATRWANQADLGVPVVAATADLSGVEDATGRDFGADQPVAPDQLIDAVASLDQNQTPLLTVDGAPADANASTTTSAGAEGAEAEPSSAADLPRVAPDAPLDTLLVLVARDPASVAAAATARASGARLMTVTNPDPRTDPEVIAALAAEPPGQVVALGTAFGSPETLRYRLDVATSGVELPGGGQILYPGRQMIALYGHPGTPALGALGEQGVDGAIARAKQMAADYQSLVDVPVVPAFEIVATVASNGAGPDGNYSFESPLDLVRPWVDAAGQASLYVVLDLQPGRTDFLTQAKRYEELLARPYVGLALDPEWRLQPNQRHLARIGSVAAAEINTVVTWLADLTRAHKLPQKLLMLHQFQPQMISDRGTVDTSRDELAVLIHADGFGSPGDKFETWSLMHVSPPPNVWWGWKNFIDEDTPTFSPAETMAIEPRPLFVSYQ
jgi:voltage-gated potassium channel Kch